MRCLVGNNTAETESSPGDSEEYSDEQGKWSQGETRRRSIESGEIKRIESVEWKSATLEISSKTCGKRGAF